MVYENESQKLKKYCSIIGTGKDGRKDFSSFGAFLWLSETFQLTLTLLLVSNFAYPTVPNLYSPVPNLLFNIFWVLCKIPA